MHRMNHDKQKPPEGLEIENVFVSLVGSLLSCVKRVVRHLNRPGKSAVRITPPTGSNQAKLQWMIVYNKNVLL